ncbi:MAG: hypothetical protein EAX95_10245 [Candidatus Thorarchaeota archaeon]|nr:hypothetical protein [Candidatus Thorarchaeota archaeon]
MSGSKKRFTYAMLLCGMISAIAMILSGLFSESEGIVPLFGLEYPVHVLLVNTIWPILGSAICAIIFPRIFTPLFLAIKKFVMPEFKNGQTDVDTKPYRFRKWLSRAFFVSLLILGMQSFLIGIFPYEALLTPNALLGYEGAGIDIRFTLGVTGGIVDLLTPIAVGIFSIAWALEDSGLVHYDLPKESDRIYEVEPIFRRYESYVKGYAGLASILYLVTIVIYFLSWGPERWIDAIVTVIYPLIAMLLSAIGYLGYIKTNTSFLKGKYPSVGRVTEDEIASK